MKRQDNVFAEIALPDVPESKFDLSHEIKTTFNMGEIVPTCLMEALPGDKFSLNVLNMIRFAPMIAPVMHKVHAITEYFFTPNRILWPNWEDFITGVDTPEAPYILLDSAVQKGSVLHYLGIPPGDYSAQSIRINALPVAGYYKSYDDWFRSQQLIPEEFVELVDGDNTTAYLKAFNDPVHCAWRHDCFTAALPTSQQGTDVALPLVQQGTLPVEWIGGASTAGRNQLFRRSDTGALLDNTVGQQNVYGDAASAPLNATSLQMATIGPVALDPNGTLGVDIESEAATINDLREAFALQAFLETSMRGGLRYFEQNWSHFRQRSPDARLQRSEFIGRYKQKVSITEVLSTAVTTNDTAVTPLGEMGGHGISVGGSEPMFYECEEHGFILGVLRVLPDTSYQQGIFKHWFRSDRLSYAFPELANLGEQPVLNKEIFAIDPAVGVTYDKEGVFGYMPNYYEYRYMPDRVGGDFADTLAFWTLGRIFDPAAPPVLNGDFVTADVSERIFAVTGEGVDHIYAQIFNIHGVVRKLPRYSIPAQLR